MKTSFRAPTALGFSERANYGIIANAVLSKTKRLMEGEKMKM